MEKRGIAMLRRLPFAYRPLCLLIAVLFSLGSLQVHAVGTKPQESIEPPDLPVLQDVGGVSAKSAVLIDANSGQVLYEKDASVRLPMASTTKIMTALCALELADADTLITVDARAVGVEGSSVYLREKEQLTLLQLLYALLLASANDAAVAIAIGTAGSVEAFADYMNQKAASLGLENTHFENPHGLDSEQHYTTARELALIAREALKNPLLRTICATKKITIPQADTQGVRMLINHNKMLRYYDGAIGVKTGFTKKSGRCLVSAAERNGLTLIAVTLCAPDDWNDHTRMLDAGFAAYESVSLCGENGFDALLPVTGGNEGYVLVRSETNPSLTLPRERSGLICTVELPRFLYADVAKGQTVGRLVFRADTDGDGRTELLAKVPLTTVYAVERRQEKNAWQRFVDRLFGKNK
ncbi:MAG: D-alanyl-D-alanine carboxypeptidase [Clostridia bacterium]|nr:D-alanyl-D-alanine carboxypeptidase [Clostridia bacterium]